LWLDSDCDGLISPTSIDLSLLGSELLVAITPLLVEMEELGTPLDCDEFTDALYRLYENTGQAQKDVFMSLKNSSTEAFCSQTAWKFRPLIDTNSK